MSKKPKEIECRFCDRMIPQNPGKGRPKVICDECKKTYRRADRREEVGR